MITLITGLPGAGKTSLLVSMLADRDDLKNRPLYVDGIPDLKIPYLEMPEGQDMTTWHIWAPTGSILVIDEAQRIFRPRPNGSKVPDFVSALETHRHKGIDIFVLTQHPRLIDTNLKSLVGNHQHIYMSALRVRKIVEWASCKNPDSKAEYANGIDRIFRLKKSAFGLYKSAEEHTKIKVKTPRVLLLLGLTLLALGYLSYKAYNIVYGDKSKPKQSEVLEVPNGQNSTASAVLNTSPSTPISPTLSVDSYVPAIPEKPETKPIYDNVRQVQSFEFPNMCIERKSTGDCKCYTHQATLIKEVPKEFCKEYVENGIFNPYKARDDFRAPTKSTDTG